MTAKKSTSELDVDIMNEVNRVPMTTASRERMSLNIYDLQYLMRLQDLSNEAFKQVFDAEFRKEVAKSVAAELAEVLAPINDKLEELAKGQKLIADDITAIKDRLDEMEDKVEDDEKRIKAVESRLDRKKRKIVELEAKVELLQPDCIEHLREEMHDLIPLLRRTARTNSTSNIILRILAGILIGIGSMFFILKYWWIKLF
jgi:chromosome segregation ATPase